MKKLSVFSNHPASGGIYYACDIFAFGETHMRKVPFTRLIRLTISA
ncbi:MAG: hypothetical protein M0R40_05100 [Firmicutes bacterium]|nr:hypothetical protein [Bacillota bacterium]